MPVKLSVVTAKTNLEQTFPMPPSEETVMYTFTNYILTGKMVSQESVVSDDGLERTYSVIFVSEEALNEYLEDKFLDENHRSERTAFCVEHGLTKTRSITID
jgi:glucokinase